MSFSNRIVQSVTCLTADPGVANSTLARSHIFAEIDHKIISTAILLLPLIQEGFVSFTSESMVVHKVLVNCLVKLAQEKSVVRQTDCLDMTIAVDLNLKP